MIDDLKEQIIEESFSDIMGLYTCVDACIKFGIDLSHLIISLFSILEGVEQLRVLRNMIDSLAVQRSRKLVIFQHPKTPARFLILFEMLNKIAKQEVPAPAGVYDYLSPLKTNPIDLSGLNSGLHRSSMTAERSLLETLNETKETIVRRFGWTLQQFENAPLKPEDIMRKHIIEQNLKAWMVPDNLMEEHSLLNWDHSESSLQDFEDGSLIGFGNACKLISKTLISPNDADDRHPTHIHCTPLETIDSIYRLVRDPRIVARNQILPELHQVSLHR